MYELIGPHSHITYTKTDIVVFGMLVVWEGVWKAIALWKAARNRQLAWFVIMAIVNTVGLLEIAYIFLFQNKEGNGER